MNIGKNTMKRFESGYEMKIVMKPDASEKQLEIARKLYPKALVLRGLEAAEEIIKVKGDCHTINYMSGGCEYLDVMCPLFCSNYDCELIDEIKKKFPNISDEEFKVIQAKLFIKNEGGEQIMENLFAKEIQDFTTRELTEELVKRGGITEEVIEPHEPFRIVVGAITVFESDGPAIIIINQD